MSRSILIPVLVSALLALASAHSLAAETDQKALCAAGQGSFMTATITAGPRFAHGKYLKGVELSHTHLKVRPDGSNDIYDVAIDNVFASDYQQNSKSVPASLAVLQVGQRLALCGQLYDDGSKGIHWVHTDCGKTPSAAKPDGFIKLLSKDGSAGQNLENNQNYCSLWGRRR